MTHEIGDPARYERERDFHDKRDVEGRRSQARRFYSVTRASTAALDEAVARYPANSRVLDLGCGHGVLARRLAERGMPVTGIDISPAVIEEARRDPAGVEFRVMNGEHLEFDNASFDLVVSSGALHHLDADRALAGIVRVLRPHGGAVFVEPLAHNPLVNMYRRRTPDARSADEHPLRMSDLDVIGRYLKTTRVRTYHLASLAAVPLRNRSSFDVVLRALEAVDRVLLAPKTLRRFGWIAVIEARRP